MSKCAVKRGIITLRDCGNEASDACARCARPVCREHVRVRGTDVLCIECYAREEERPGEQTIGKKLPGSGGSGKGAKGVRTSSGHAPRVEETESGDSMWAYLFRDFYYRQIDYRPVYWGHRHDHYYDDYDLRSFDDTLGYDESYDDPSEGGFYDS